MPIYAYRCETCGFAKDVLQKISDAPLSVCPSCDKPTFKKQLTAAGFQLKGTGWYVTDFRGGSGGGTSAPAASSPAEKSAEKSAEKPASGSAAGGEAKSADAKSSTP